jgi:hypothetical protein
MVRRSIALPAAAVLLCLDNVLAAQAGSQILRKVNDLKLCAAVEFASLTIDVRDGIRESETDPVTYAHLGDPLTATDVDLREHGFEVQIDFRSPGTHADEVSVSIFTSKPAKNPYGELTNWEEVEAGLKWFTKPCQPTELEESRTQNRGH